MTVLYESWLAGIIDDDHHKYNRYHSSSIKGSAGVGDYGDGCDRHMCRRHDSLQYGGIIGWSIGASVQSAWICLSIPKLAPVTQVERACVLAARSVKGLFSDA